MEGLSAEVLPILQYLMPGFLAMMIFYWFADSPKPAYFERILQALVTTAVVQIFVKGMEQLSYLIGSYYSLGEWDETSAAWAALAIAAVTGLTLAHFANNDTAFRAARFLKFTTKASQDDAVHIHKQLTTLGIILHFTDGRRLMGYLDAYPPVKQTGVYLVSSPIWITAGARQECPETYAIMISGSDVQWVEFLK